VSLELAQAHAPLVVLHADEEYWPIDPEEFVRRSALVWQGPDGADVVAPAGTVEAARLGRAGDSYASPDGAHHTAEHTRPFDRRDGLAEREGFVLRLDGDEARLGSPPAAGAARFDGVPVFYEHDEPAGLISYWAFYAASTVPALVRDLDLRSTRRAARAGADEQIAGAIAERDERRILQQLRVGYPQLEPAAPETGAALGFPDLAGWAKKLYWHLRNDDFPVAHEGDWERIAVVLDGGRATHVDYYQHHGAERCPRREARPVVYSALGSHASVPRQVAGLDDTVRAGLEWHTWYDLRDVREAGWFGYGGAWGNLGEVSDGTGPLGPSRWKRPARELSACE
jgi:hypothetical protein